MSSKTAALAVLLAAALLVWSTDAYAGATITIVNMNKPNVGFNDPTPAAPVGGNPGTTLGRQRLIAFQHAANIWGETLDSAVQIRIQASFVPLACSATSAVLGAAGTIQIVADFPNAPAQDIWYPVALANKLAGTDLIPGRPGTSADDIIARFNSDLDNPTCLGPVGWYYGLDNAHGNDIDLVTVLLHEFSHGLGFQSFVNKATGAEILGRGDVYSGHIYDNTANKVWNEMTDAGRAASALNTRDVVWNGTTVTAAAPGVLQLGTPALIVNSPVGIAGRYPVGTAVFGAALTAGGLTGDVVLANDGTSAPARACQPLTNGSAVTGKIALVDRGACTFVVKAKNAQNAGAIGVLVADNVAGSPPPGLGGSDPTITIPAVRIALADGTRIKANLPSPGVNVTLKLDMTQRAGTDVNGKVLLWTPKPLQLGSSISHWDEIATPNQLMEPAINDDLTHEVKPPKDLTLPLLTDIGWTSGGGQHFCSSPDTGPAVGVDGCPTEVPNIFFGSIGCSLADMVALCQAGAGTHGDFVSCVASLTNTLNQNDIITGEQKSRIESCSARSSVP